MTSPEDEQADPYAAYFRPTDDAPVVDVPVVGEAVDDEPADGQPADVPAIASDPVEITHDSGAPEEMPASEPVPTPTSTPTYATDDEASAGQSVIDTGRLFRSQGVDGHDATVLALGSDHGGRLRTLERSSEATGHEASGPVVVAVTSATENPPVDDRGQDEPRRRGRRSRERSGGSAELTTSGLRAIGVYVVVMGVTVLVGFGNALISDGKLTWITGLALLISSAYAAVTVRRSDDMHAVVVPPLAFALAAATAAQAFAGPTVQSVIDRAVVWFFTLADNWAWIIGSTLAALAIVAVRRYRK